MYESKVEVFYHGSSCSIFGRMWETGKEEGNTVTEYFKEAPVTMPEDTSDA